MHACRTAYLSILLLPLVFAPLARSEILLAVPDDIADALPEDIRDDAGETATVSGAFRSFSRDRRNFDPAYPWVLETEAWTGFLDDEVSRAAGPILASISAGDQLTASGSWGVLLSAAEPPWPGSVAVGDRRALAVLVVTSLASRPVPSAGVSSPPRPDLAAVARAVQAEELKAVRDPSYASPARRKIAQLYVKSGQYEKAINEYRFDMILDPARSSSGHRKIAEIYKLMGDGENARIELELSRLTQKESRESLYRQRLTKWIKQGKYELAIQEYNYLLQADSRSRPEYLEKIAQLYSLLGDRARARDYYGRLIREMQETARQTAAQRLDKSLRLAAIYEDMGDFDAARAQYENALQASPGKKEEVLIKTAQFLERRKDYPGALAVYRRMEGMPDADRAGLAERSARLMERNKDIGGAIAEYERAAKFSRPPDSSRIRWKRAALLSSSGRLQEALAAYREAAGDLTGAARAEAVEETGDLLVKLKKEEEARAAYREAGSLLLASRSTASGREDVVRRLADLAEKAGDAEVARRYREETASLLAGKIRDDPASSVRSRRRLIDLLEKLEKWDEAAAQYQEWIAREPDNSSPYYRLYRLYRDKLKNEEQAKTWEEKYQEMKRK
jgi:tetratricopeptide (TPR) repeat protein